MSIGPKDPDCHVGLILGTGMVTRFTCIHSLSLAIKVPMPVILRDWMQ